MTTKIRGSNYLGPINEVLNLGQKVFLLGNVGRDNLRVVLTDTEDGTIWKIPGPRAEVILCEGGVNIPVISINDKFTGGEGRSLFFQHPVYRDNRIEVYFNKRERK